MANLATTIPDETRKAPAVTGSYRPEIDGLRAIAVLSVMMYHAEVRFFSVGYLGVDIFFAISGFLITGIIVSSSEQGRFALAGFYMRRIRRIIPALTFMCLITLLFALPLMIPDDLENFGQSMVATGLSANNILLYLTSGYFELETFFKPLFHTWSLGVEEQYYVIVPLLLMLAMRWGGRRGAFVVLAVSSAVSLIFCEYIRLRDYSANFLLLPSRFWELGFGGMTAIAQAPLLNWIGNWGRLREGLAATGMAMIVSSLFLLTGFYDLPGWQALLPLLGTCLVLAFANQTMTGRMLTTRPIAGIGLISYSAYLYHAPLFAFVRIASLNPVSPALLIGTIPFCLLMAWLSWRYVEAPFRDPGRISNRTVLVFCGVMTALTVGSGLILHLTSGFFTLSAFARHDQQLGRGLTAIYNEGPRVFTGRQMLPANKERNVMVIGNSFARDFINMGLETGKLSHSNISYEMIQNCEVIPPAVLDRIRNAQSVIFGSGATIEDIPCLTDKIAALRSLAVPHIIVLGTKQFGYNNNAVMLLPEARRYNFRAKPLAYASDANTQVRRAIPSEYYVDLFALLDDGTGTVPVFTPGHKFISQDTKHLTKAGARYLGDKVFAQPQFSWLTEQIN
jgi:peptidoglycan/LPS O-acetylase OafA/YrhL